MKVAKFGGSSVKDATAMKRVADIVCRDAEIKLVVISATQNTTNELEQIARAAREQQLELMQKNVNSLITRHLQIARELDVSDLVDSFLNDLGNELKHHAQYVFDKKELTPALMDSIYSIGERMSSLLVANYIKKHKKPDTILFDVREVMLTDDTHNSANPIVDQIELRANDFLRPKLETNLVITQGFIGKTIDGQMTVLGREGSDFSATILGEAINADAVMIWTDVPGVATTDPRLVPEARYLKNLSYAEATLLAKLGAKVLFSRTLEPAQRKGIPVIVCSSLEPEKKGTIIDKNSHGESGIIGLTFKKRGEESVLSIVGSDIDDLQIDLPEVDRGEGFRSFLVETKALESTLARWHQEFVQK